MYLFAVFCSANDELQKSNNTQTQTDARTIGTKREAANKTENNVINSQPASDTLAAFLSNLIELKLFCNANTLYSRYTAAIHNNNNNNNNRSNNSITAQLVRLDAFLGNRSDLRYRIQRKNVH